MTMYHVCLMLLAVAVNSVLSGGGGFGSAIDCMDASWAPLPGSSTRCVKLIYKRGTGLNAMMDCYRDGKAHVAIPKDIGETNFMISMMQAVYNVNRVWIGPSDHNSDGVFMGPRDSALSWVNWATDHPVVAATPPFRKCTQMDINGKWMSYWCQTGHPHSSQPTICESCKNGYWQGEAGFGCTEACPGKNCLDDVCDITTAECVRGCKPGFSGPNCDGTPPLPTIPPTVPTTIPPTVPTTVAPTLPPTLPPLPPVPGSGGLLPLIVPTAPPSGGLRPVGIKACPGLREDPSSPHHYQMEAPGHGWLQMPCAPSTCYKQAMCGCSVHGCHDNVGTGGLVPIATGPGGPVPVGPGGSGGPGGPVPVGPGGPLPGGSGGGAGPGGLVPIVLPTGGPTASGPVTSVQGCVPGKWGVTCQNDCAPNCDAALGCNHYSGECRQGCQPDLFLCNVCKQMMFDGGQAIIARLGGDCTLCTGLFSEPR